MELIDSEEDNKTALPEPEPRYRSASATVNNDQGGQAWLRILAAILVGLILVILIVLLARWVYHRVHHNATPVPATSQQSPANSSASKTSGAQPAANSNSAPAQSSGSASNSTSSPSSSQTGTSTKLTNTGPGDVAAIFVGTALAAAGLHYIISLRRFNKTGI